MVVCGCQKGRRERKIEIEEKLRDGATLFGQSTEGEG